jgi:hypothetical protein
VFNFFKRGIETGCTGRAYQMPENTHRNRMIHFYILIVFIGQWLPADLMSVKIRQFGTFRRLPQFGFKWQSTR